MNLRNYTRTEVTVAVVFAAIIGLAALVGWARSSHHGSQLPAGCHWVLINKGTERLMVCSPTP